MTEYKIPFLLTSSLSSGAQNRSSDNSQFEVTLDRPLIIPKNSINCYLTAQQSTVWWTVSNIKAGVNDQMYITYFNGLVNVFAITIPDGLYDITQLDNAINREIVNAGFPNNLITLVGDNATQKTIIQINALAPDTISIDFTPADTFRDIIGFNSQVIPAQSGPVSIFSDNQAAFNQIEFFLIHCSLADLGLRINNNYNNVIAQIGITVPPGSQIVDTPFLAPEIPAQSLIGTKTTNIKMSLTDQDNNPVDTKEDFSCRFIVHYTIPDKHNYEIN